MAQIGKVSAVFTASTSGLTAGVARAASSMKQMETVVGSLRGSMRSLVAIQGAQLFGSIASSASSAIGSLVRMGQAQAEVVDQSSKLAARLGMTYQEFSGLSLAGELAGVSMDTIAAAATKADVAFVKAANGSAAAVAAFNNIGLSVEQLNGMSASERFDAIAQAISEIPNEAERSAAAVALFGRSGAQLLPLFADGAAGIAQARQEAERFGLALTNAQGKDVEAMNDAFTRAQAAIQGVVQQVVAYLSPAVKAVTDSFTNLIGNIGGANIGQAIGDGILQGARYLATVGDYIIANVGPAFEYLSQVGAQWSAVWEFGQRVATFFGAIGDTLQAAFGILIMGISGPVQSLMEAAKFIGDRLGIDTSGLESSIAAMKAFNNTLGDGITQNLNSAAKGFSDALSTDGPAVGEAIAGPLTMTIDQAIANAQQSAASISEATKGPIEIKQVATVNAAAFKEAVQGIDSRSAEGIKEMFRIMRGPQDRGVQEQQLDALQRIADNTDGMGDGFNVEAIDLAPAAGA